MDWAARAAEHRPEGSTSHCSAIGPGSVTLGKGGIRDLRAPGWPLGRSVLRFVSAVSLTPLLRGPRKPSFESLGKKRPYFRYARGFRRPLCPGRVQNRAGRDWASWLQTPGVLRLPHLSCVHLQAPNHRPRGSVTQGRGLRVRVRLSYLSDPVWAAHSGQMSRPDTWNPGP